MQGELIYCFFLTIRGNMEPFKLKKKLITINSLIRDEKAKKKPDIKFLNRMNKIKNNMENELEEATGGLSISDHAMLRYLQRAMDIDVESLRWGLLNIIRKVYKGNGSYPLGNNMYAIIKNKVVASIIEGKTDFQNKGNSLFSRRKPSE